MSVDARRGHWTIKAGDDARYPAFGCGRVAGDDRLSGAGGIGTPHEVELPPRGAVLVAEHVLGVDGTGQVDLQGGVDGDDVIVLGDDVWVVDIIHGVALDGRVVVEEVVHGLLPHCESEYGLPGIEPRAPVGPYATFDQLDHPGTECLGVDAETL